MVGKAALPRVVETTRIGFAGGEEEERVVPAGNDG